MQRNVVAPRPYLFGAIMFLIAFVQFSVGPTVPIIAQHFGVPETSLGIAFAFQFAGAFLALLAGGILTRRFGYTRNLLTFTLLFVAAASALPFSPTLWLICAVLFLMGAASAHAQVTIFALIELLYGEQGNKYQNLVGSAFAMGAVMGPLVTGLTGTTIGWGTVFWTGTALGVPIVAWLRRSVHGIAVPQPQDGARNADSAMAGWFWALSLALISYLAAEGIVNSWLSTYLKEWLGASPEWQGISLSIFWIGIAAGRLLTGRIARWLSLHTVITGCGIAAAVVLGAAVQAQTVAAAVALFGLAGVCFGGLAPSLISLQAQQPNGPERLYLYFAMGQLGPMLVPYIAGRVADVTNFYYAFLLAIPALFGMLLFLGAFQMLRSKQLRNN